MSRKLLASQLPIADWFSQFTHPTHADAILDRIIRNAYRVQLQGESQRKLRAAFPMPSTRFIIPSPALLHSTAGRHEPDSVDDFTGIRTHFFIIM